MIDLSKFRIFDIIVLITVCTVTIQLHFNPSVQKISKWTLPSLKIIYAMIVMINLCKLDARLFVFAGNTRSSHLSVFGANYAPEYTIVLYIQNTIGIIHRQWSREDSEKPSARAYRFKTVYALVLSLAFIHRAGRNARPSVKPEPRRSERTRSHQVYPSHATSIRWYRVGRQV